MKILKERMMITTSDEDIKKNNTFIFNALNEYELKYNSFKKGSGETNTGDCIMDNETFSFKFEDGSYIANFAYTPSSRVGNQLLFKGILYGKGHFIGHKCIVRTNIPGTEESWQRYAEVRKKLRSIRDIFLANGCPDNFHVPKSALANMDRAAFPSKLASMFSRWCEPKQNDWVFVDLYRSPHKETIRTGPMFSAVSHISLKQSNGQSYLTNFRAFDFNEGSVCITDADISTDIALFNKWHQCTKLCEMEMPLTKSEPISIQKDLPELFRMSSAPNIGDFHFWCREAITVLPPYSEYPPEYSPPEYPPPSAPPIPDNHCPFAFPGPHDHISDFLRQFSIG